MENKSSNVLHKYLETDCNKRQNHVDLLRQTITTRDRFEKKTTFEMITSDNAFIQSKRKLAIDRHNLQVFQESRQKLLNDGH